MILSGTAHPPSEPSVDLAAEQTCRLRVDARGIPGTASTPAPSPPPRPGMDSRQQVGIISMVAMAAAIVPWAFFVRDDLLACFWAGAPLWLVGTALAAATLRARPTAHPLPRWERYCPESVITLVVAVLAPAVTLVTAALTG